jgi:hypothetical protein
MGHYKKKEYKKKPIDSWLQNTYDYQIQEALDDYSIFDDPIDVIEEEIPQTTMLEKPVIVQELLEEERQGILPTWMIDPADESWIDSLLVDLAIHTKQHTTQMNPIHNYEKTYKKAKKISDLL